MSVDRDHDANLSFEELKQRASDSIPAEALNFPTDPDDKGNTIVDGRGIPVVKLGDPSKRDDLPQPTEATHKPIGPHDFPGADFDGPQGKKGEAGGSKPIELALSNAQQVAIKSSFGFLGSSSSSFEEVTSTVSFTGTVIDKDGDGKLSVGDVAKIRNETRTDEIIRDEVLTKPVISRIEQQLQKDEPPVTEAAAGFKILDKEELLDISNGLSEQKKARLLSALNLFAGSQRVKATSPDPAGNNGDNRGNNGYIAVSRYTKIARVNDKDSDGKLSAGDTVELILNPRLGKGPSSPQMHILTQAEIDRYLAAPSFQGWFAENIGDFNDNGTIDTDDIRAYKAARSAGEVHRQRIGTDQAG